MGEVVGGPTDKIVGTIDNYGNPPIKDDAKGANGRKVNGAFLNPPAPLPATNAKKPSSAKLQAANEALNNLIQARKESIRARDEVIKSSPGESSSGLSELEWKADNADRNLREAKTQYESAVRALKGAGGDATNLEATELTSRINFNRASKLMDVAQAPARNNHASASGPATKLSSKALGYDTKISGQFNHNALAPSLEGVNLNEAEGKKHSFNNIFADSVAVVVVAYGHNQVVVAPFVRADQDAMEALLEDKTQDGIKPNVYVLGNSAELNNAVGETAKKHATTEVKPAEPFDDQKIGPGQITVNCRINEDAKIHVSYKKVIPNIAQETAKL